MKPSNGSYNKYAWLSWLTAGIDRQHIISARISVASGGLWLQGELAPQKKKKNLALHLAEFLIFCTWIYFLFSLIWGGGSILNEVTLWMCNIVYRREHREHVPITHCLPVACWIYRGESRSGRKTIQCMVLLKFLFCAHTDVKTKRTKKII